MPLEKPRRKAEPGTPLTPPIVLQEPSRILSRTSKYQALHLKVEAFSDLDHLDQAQALGGRSLSLWRIEIKKCLWEKQEEHGGVTALGMTPCTSHRSAQRACTVLAAPPPFLPRERGRPSRQQRPWLASVLLHSRPGEPEQIHSTLVPTGRVGLAQPCSPHTIPSNSAGVVVGLVKILPPSLTCTSPFRPKHQQASSQTFRQG